MHPDTWCIRPRNRSFGSETRAEKMQKAPARAGAFRKVVTVGSEAIVDAEAADLVGHPHGRRQDTQDVGVVAAGVEVKVLELPRPVAVDRAFDAGASGPAETAILRAQGAETGHS